MFDQPPKVDINLDFPTRSWVGVSCANLACPNYAKTDARYPKAGKYKGRQRYKCNRCQKTFYRLDPPEGKFRINRASEREDVKNIPSENEDMTMVPKEDLEVDQPKQKQRQRKEVSFLLTYQATQGLHRVCNSLSIECKELLEQIGQGTLEVQFSKKEIKLSSSAMAGIRNINSSDS